jgi:hypothetical protein
VFGEVRPDSKGELACINRSVPLNQLPSSLHSEYPNGYTTCFPAIRYANGSVKYLKATTNFEITHELLIVALDEVQTSLPDEPVWVRIGRYELVDNVSHAEIIESIEGRSSFQESQPTGTSKIEFTLLPMWKTGDMIIEKALVQVRTLERILFKNSC